MITILGADLSGITVADPLGKRPVPVTIYEAILTLAAILIARRLTASRG
jgi:uncharacterized protein with NAD-binding domain and iron-sulfur cluster